MVSSIRVIYLQRWIIDVKAYSKFRSFRSAEQRQLELIALRLMPWAIPVSLAVTPIEHDIPTTILTTRGRDGTKAVALCGQAKDLYFLPQGTLSNFPFHQVI